MTKSRRKPSRITVSQLQAFLEQKAPAATAETWDNVGLLVGRASALVRGVVISDDLTAESIETAQKLGYSAILNHHPCIFPRQKGLSSLNDGGSSALVFEAASRGIAVLASHTNFDQCALEVPQAVSRSLGFQPEGRLYDSSSAGMLKLVVFVPKTHFEEVRRALTQAGAGHIGNYDECTFSVEGQGTFRGLEGADPFLGRPGTLERAEEIRLETIFPRGLRRQIVRAMEEAHPYEEVAYDIYALETRLPGKGLSFGIGYGVYGSLPRQLRLGEVVRRCEKAFHTKGALVTDAGRPVTRIAFVAGKGSSFMKDALTRGCDLFITGEAGYHDARVASERGMSVIELGHRESEYFFLQTAAQWMKELGLPHRVLNTPIQRFARG